MQEDKEGFFDTVDTLLSTLEVFAGMIKTIKVRPDKMSQAARQGYLLATDLADYLVNKGQPFRTAHDTVARLVTYAIEKGKSLAELAPDEYRAFSPLFDDDVYSITVESSIASRDIVGGTALKQVEQALANAKNLIGDLKPQM